MPAKNLKIHFIGIGGIGVSALARYYLAKGHEVSGSDLTYSEITEALEKLGAKISIGKNIIKKDADSIIYSPAVPRPKGGRPMSNILSYPEALGELTKKYFTIAVSGTHGKSTTTAMLGLLLTKAGLDPTVIVGTKLKEFGDSNCRVGKSKYLVIEADEHMASFLNYWPKVIVLTTIEADHLDYYKNLKNYIASFKKYIGHLPKDGVLIANKDDKNIRKIIRDRISRGYPISRYSIKQPEAQKLKKVLKIPGDHNVYNALASLTAARILKIPDKVSFKTLAAFKGSWRRFQIDRIKLHENRSREITLISDYGHHPTEVSVTLKAAREKYPNKKIWCFFQPHQCQRTYYLFKDFVRIFRQAPIDKIMITDIYDVAGRETPELKKKVSAEKLVKAIGKKNAAYLPKNRILDYLKKNLQGGEVIIIMGAGDIYNITRGLTAR
ncbi:MAG: UDP-N-acetylmuramate--L-alanine ligase [bacterium]